MKLNRNRLLLGTIILASVIRLGTIYPQNSVGKSIIKMADRQDKMVDRIKYLRDFEDSFYDDQEFRLQVLDSFSTKAALDDLVRSQQQELQVLLLEGDQILLECDALRSKYNFYEALNNFLNVVIVVCLLLIGIQLFR